MSLHIPPLHPAAAHEAVDLAAAAATAAIAPEFLKHLQQKYQDPFASHCFVLSLLLRAATQSPPLRPHCSHPDPQQQLSRHALDRLRQLCRRCCCICSVADQRLPPLQLHRVLCYTACAAALAVRLTSRSSGGGWCVHVAAARVARRFFSVRGANALLRTCSPPPEFPCA